MISFWLLVAVFCNLLNVFCAQLFVPEYCDWPLFPASPCIRMQFTPVNPSATGSFQIQWQLWSALNSPPNFAKPFMTANHFRYVTTNGASDIGLTARAQSDLMNPSATTTSLCLRFYYYVSSNTNQLSIFLVERTSPAGTTTSKLVWQLPAVGAVIGEWTRSFAATSVASSANQFLLQIEATSNGLQPGETALARLSVTFGQCFDIIEEDIISAPSTNTPLAFWPLFSTVNIINIVYDPTFWAGANAAVYQTQFQSLLATTIFSAFSTAFEVIGVCSLSFIPTNLTTIGTPHIRIIREPSVNSVICASMIGPFSNVATEIHVTESCFTASNSRTLLLHLIAHALGLKHQHRRADRHTSLILNSYAYDPIYQPFFDTDTTISTTETSYDLASVTQVGPNFLDQTGGRSPYGTFSSIDGFAFGVASFFTYRDLLRVANLLGGPNSPCSVRRAAKCQAFCYNGGVCARRPATTDQGVCQCRAGFTGQQCTLLSCFPPCQNGFCDPGNVCNCASVSNLWTGYRCHIPVSSLCNQNCLNGGTCVTANGLETCICQPGYTGVNCGTVICEQCQNNQCPASTTCVSPNRLNCSVGTTGSRCEQCATGYIGNSITGCKPYCSTNCSGNGQCSAPETCQCKPGWTGSLCQTCISGFEYLCFGSTTLSPTCYPPCSSYGGYCSSQGICTCYQGFEGLTCDRIALSSTNTPAPTRTTTTITTPYSPTTTPLIRCYPKPIPNLDQTQLYARYILSPYEINFQVLSTLDDQVTNERQSLEDFLNRALRDELNRFTDNRFMRLAIVNVCPGIVVDVVISYFTALNATTASRVIIQQARAIGVPLTDGKTALSRLDFDYISPARLSPVNVNLCSVYNDLDACKNGARCLPEVNLTGDETATFSPLMTPVNVPWPMCQCAEGFSGEFCTDAELPLPIWAIVAIAGGGILLIALAAVTVHMLCGSGRQPQHRQQRYHRSHPLPPPPGPRPGYMVMPCPPRSNVGTLPHPGGAPYNVPLVLPPSQACMPQPAAMSIPNEPPPPYHHISFPGNMPPPQHTMGTIPRSNIRADDVDNDDLPNMGQPPDFDDLQPPPGYTLTHQQMMAMPPHHHYIPPPPQRTLTVADSHRNRHHHQHNSKMMKRPKLGR